MADPELLEALQQESKSFTRKIKEVKLLKRRAEPGRNIHTDTESSSAEDLAVSTPFNLDNGMSPDHALSHLEAPSASRTPTLRSQHFIHW